MRKADVETLCRRRADELLEKYFPDFIREASVIRPEHLDPLYSDDLPAR